jgi:hypothetical protein
VVRRLLAVAPLAHGGESEGHRAPVLNMTSVGKCPLKITGKKIWILGLSGLWDISHGVQSTVLYLFLNQFRVFECKSVFQIAELDIEGIMCSRIVRIMEDQCERKFFS